MFDIDSTKLQLSRAIQNNQSYLNSCTTRNLKNKQALSNRGYEPRSSMDRKNEMKRNLAEIHKEQIELKNIDTAGDLILSRIQDEEDLMAYREKYPFGKENVSISEDVLERYRGNYHAQSEMLERFKRDAEMKRKLNRPQPKQRLVINCPHPKSDNSAELQKIWQSYQMQLLEQKRKRELQKQRMKNLAKMLGGLSTQLHNNSYTLEKGIRELQSKFTAKEHKSLDLKPKRPQFKDTLDLEMSCRKIPIIIYKDQPHDARLYFSDVYRTTDKIPKQSLESKQDYQNMVRILNENKRRLEYLNHYPSYKDQIL